MEPIAADSHYIGNSMIAAGGGILLLVIGIILLASAEERTRARWATAATSVVLGIATLVGAAFMLAAGVTGEAAQAAGYRAAIEARYGLALSDAQVKELGFPVETPAAAMPLGETGVLEPVDGSDQQSLTTIRLIWDGQTYTLTTATGLIWAELPLANQE